MQAVRAFRHIMPADNSQKRNAIGKIDAQLSGTLYRLPSLSRDLKRFTFLIHGRMNMILHQTHPVRMTR